MAINAGARPRARRWAQQFYQAYPDLAGLYYASSMHRNAAAVALNERALALGVMPVRPVFHRVLADPSMWRVLQGVWGVKLIWDCEVSHFECQGAPLLSSICGSPACFFPRVF